MTYGDNLFSAYYNGMRYAPSPQLWLEADSWGAATWANKGDGGYDLAVESGYHGAKDGNAIVSTSASKFRYSVSRNVVGTGSFTIEAVAAPDDAMKSDTYGGWLCNQRTASTNQNGAMQMVFSKAGNFSGGVINSSGALSAALGGWAAGTAQYFSWGYDAVEKRLWCRMGERLAERSDVAFACTVSAFTLGSQGWQNRNSPFLGRLYSLRVYRRTLASEEIAHNYTLDKIRFSIA